MPPMPERHGAWGIYDTFPTADGRLFFLGITSNQHWQRFCALFERADLLADEALDTNEKRVAARPRLLPVVAEAVARHSEAEMVEMCERAGLPFAPTARPGDLPGDPQLNAHGRMLEVAIGGGRHARLPRLPLEMGMHDTGLRRQPGRIGEDTLAILAELGIRRRRARAGVAGVVRRAAPEAGEATV